MTFSPRLARIVRRALLTFAVIATLAVLAVLVENWRGDRAWRRYAAHAATRGEPLDRLPNRSLPSDERNFMKTPLMDRWLFSEGSKGDPGLTTLLESWRQPMNSTVYGWKRGLMLDLARFAREQREQRELHGESGESAGGEPARDVLVGLEPMAGIIAELRAAATARTSSILVHPGPGPSDEPFGHPIPSFTFLGTLSGALVGGASAALEEGRAGEAAENVRVLLKIVQGFSESPDGVLLTGMLGAALTDHVIQPIWEGCRRRAWSETELREIQQQLSHVSPLRAFEQGLRGDRVHAIALLDRLPGGTWWLSGLPHVEGGDGRSWRRIFPVPRGWLAMNKIVYCESVELMLDVIARVGTPEFLQRRADAETRLRQIVREDAFENSVARMAGLERLTRFMDHVLAQECSVSLAQTACALERYRLALGVYPRSLDALVPEFVATVPADPIDGQPLRYRLTKDGEFDLYSIGLDGEDGGGAQMPLDVPGDGGSGDWCWPRVTSAAP